MEYSSTSDDRLAYRDFSNVDEQDWLASTIEKNNFPAKLHYVLSEMDKEGLQHVASWQTHGRCFFVHDKDKFTQNILPFWFSQSKYDSFQRQLNSYGFVRVTSGPDKGGYYHELFLRGKIFLTRGIHRRKSRDRSSRQEANSQTINFYEFPALPDTSSKQPDKNLVSPSSLSVLINNRSALTLQVPQNFKPSLFTLNAHEISANEATATIRQLERSLLPSQYSCAMHNTATATRPFAMRFSLVEILFQQLKSSPQSSSRSCASANI